MSNQITSQVLGQLTKDENISFMWNNNGLSFPLFENKILPVSFIGYEPGTDEGFIPAADSALQNLLALSITDRNSFSAPVYKNYTDLLAELDEDGEDESFYPKLDNLNSPEDIWKFVHPTSITVERRDRRDMDIYISVSCECDWEDEHGLQLVFRQGKKLTRVSGHDGHLTESDAYDYPDEQDELLSKF